MKRYLMRGTKHPFSFPDAFESFDKNLAAHNVGNYLFMDAAHRLLSTSVSEVVMGGYTLTKKRAQQVNSEYDGFILPMANLFHQSRVSALRALTEFIEELEIPVLLTSVGAQAPADMRFDSLMPIAEDVSRFCRAVLNRSHSIAVRGQFTASFLQSLGFHDVSVVGCPSLTLAGRSLKVRNVIDGFGRPVGYNASVNTNIAPELFSYVDSLPGSVYFPQDYTTLELMLWGHSRLRSNLDRRLPVHVDHPQFTRGRAEFMLDSVSWRERMRDFGLVFGPRIHGNIVALLAGTPAVVLCHDSRTLELAEFHGIPHFRPAEISGLRDFSTIVARADVAEFNKSHASHFDRYLSFLEGGGYTHIYSSGEEKFLSQYDETIRTSVRQPPVRATWAEMSSIERARLRRSRVKELRG